MFFFKKISFVFYILIISQKLFASNSYESWTKVVLEKKLPHSVKLEFSQGIRFKDYISEVNQAFFEFSFSYKNSRGLKFNFPIRYSIYKDKIKHRASLVTSYQHNFNQLSVKYIFKFYRLYQNGEMTGEDEIKLGDIFRNKVHLKYKTDSFYNPFISSELLFLFQSSNNFLEQYRISSGIEIDLPKKNSMVIFLTFKKENNNKLSSDKIYIFGINFISEL